MFIYVVFDLLIFLQCHSVIIVSLSCEQTICLYHFCIPVTVLLAVVFVDKISYAIIN